MQWSDTFCATSSLYCIAALIGLQRDGGIGSYPTVTKALIEIHGLGNEFQERVGFVAKLSRNAFPRRDFLRAKEVSLSHREKHRHLGGKMNSRRFGGRTQRDMMTWRQSCHSCFAWVCLPLKRIQINAAAVGTGCYCTTTTANKCCLTPPALAYHQGKVVRTFSLLPRLLPRSGGTWSEGSYRNPEV